MRKDGVSIKYGDIAPEAKENFVPKSNESAFDTLYQLQQYNASLPNYGNPMDLYSVVLDGSAIPFPSSADTAYLGMWSKQSSDDLGQFNDPIVISFESEELYSSKGITLTFDSPNDIYCNHLSIQWFRVDGDTIQDLGSAEFRPDSSVYFCSKEITLYNKIVITFYSLNMPNNRLKLRSIDYGYGTFFYGDELRSVKVIQEIDPLSTQISINTVDFVLDGKGDMVYSFQNKQPISVYFNGKLISTTFVKSSKRHSKFLWNVQSEDYIGMLEDAPYKGGIFKDTFAAEILEDIFRSAKIPYNLDDSFSTAKVSGYIPYTTCRNALMQVAFAINAVVDTSNSDVVKIFSLGDDVKQNIGLDRIMQGQSFDDEDIVTGVEVSSHSYKEIDDDITLYDASESGSGQNIFIKFNQPIHSLSANGGDIIESGTNYAIINADEDCVLVGKKYDHTTTTKRRDNVLPSKYAFENIAAVDGATLVSPSNVDKVLEKCYNYFVNRNSVSMKIVDGKHVYGGDFITYGSVKYGVNKYGSKTDKITYYDEPVFVGDRIKSETEYSGNVIGTIVKQSFNLNGGVVIKDCILK